jgi:hypothetical protein
MFKKLLGCCKKKKYCNLSEGYAPTDQYIYSTKGISTSLSDLSQSLVPSTVICSARSRSLLKPQAVNCSTVVTVLCVVNLLFQAIFQQLLLHHTAALHKSARPIRPTRIPDIQHTPPSMRHPIYNVQSSPISTSKLYASTKHILISPQGHITRPVRLIFIGSDISGSREIDSDLKCLGLFPCLDFLLFLSITTSRRTMDPYHWRHWSAAVIRSLC